MSEPDESPGCVATRERASALATVNPKSVSQRRPNVVRGGGVVQIPLAAGDDRHSLSSTLRKSAREYAKAGRDQKSCRKLLG
jgi:hypothetical protein